MLDKNPLVSIVIPCFNVQNTVLETLDSIEQQTYPYYEIILINDGSVDNTERILLEYAKCKDNIKVLSQANNGQASARNKGLEMANGEFVVFVDADDKLHPDFLAECISVFLSDSSVNIVYTEMQTFERENSIYNLREFKVEEFLITNCIPVYCMVRCNHLESIGGFDVNMTNNEDWECWIRLYKTFKGKVVKINKVLYYYRKRIHEDSVSDLSVKNKQVEESFRYVYTKNYDFYLENKLGIWDLFHTVIERGGYKSKYYNIWYKRYFYKIFFPKKYKELSNSASFFTWKE